jgi:hypothetical protein
MRLRSIRGIIRLREKIPRCQYRPPRDENQAVTPGPPEPGSSHRVLEALARVLMPLVRLLIARGITYQATAEVLKRVYVLAARNHFNPGEEATGTRLSLLTGLNRKEIRRLTEGETKAVELEGIASHAAAVHAVWTSQRRFRDRNGAPRVLPRHSRDEKPSFDELVRNITTDHRPAALLEELVRLELVDVDAEGNIALRHQPFLSRASFTDRLRPFAANLEDHAAAAVENVLGREPPFLERSVFSDELSEESAERLHELVRQRWREIHDEAIAQAIAQEKQDKKDGKAARSRIRMGMYFYSQTKDRE